MLPLLLCVVLWWRRRTRALRDVGNQSRTLLRALEQAIGEARTLPAKDGAPRVARALTDLARQLTVASADYKSLLERVETESFDPQAANQPIAAARLDELLALARAWCQRSTPRAQAASVAVWLAVGISIAGGFAVWAQAGDTVAAARAAYRAALQEKDRDRRAHAFAGAEASFRALTRAYPDRPELLTDWGNAALGAEDLGQATLAYRRALRLAPDLLRARGNLAWARRQLPSWVPQPREGGAAESLFFWHRFLSRPERHVTAAAFFALALLLFCLGGAESMRLAVLRRAALVPLTLWAVLVVSLASGHDPSADAVLTADAITLRSADSVGAPSVFDKQLPQGTECTILEKRESWLRIQLADGVTGWITAGGCEPITSDERPSS
jgi:tetratricopeptide (TPR) repeat protein